LKHRGAKYTLIRGFLKDNSSSIFYTFILGVLLLFPLIMSPVFKRVFTDSILINNTSEWLTPLLCLMGGIAVFSALVTWIQKSCLLRLSNKIELAGAASYMWRLFNAPLDLFRHKDSFVLISGAASSSLISKTLCSDILSLLSAAVSVVFYYIMMFRLDRIMSLIVLALTVLNLFLEIAQGRLVDLFSPVSAEKLSPRDLSLRDERISSRGLQSIETFKATASETHFFQQMMSSKIRIINANGPDDESDSSAPFINFPEIFFLNILLRISALRIMNREFTIGSYLAFQAYAAAFFYPMSRVLSAPGLFIKLEKRLQGLYRELEAGAGKPDAGPVLSRAEEPEGAGGEKRGSEKREGSVAALSGSPGKLRGYIEFKDVGFSHEGVPIIEHFSLSLKPGQRAALVGKSGCGKSSVVKLLQGLYIPDAGEITIDGIPVSRIDRKTFMASIGCANQEMNFFTASIRNNITLWDDTVSDGAVYRAVKDVRLHSYIASLDGAYDHMLEENARALSGGQRQRLEIARALLYNPSVVIMDEVTGDIGSGMAEEIEKNLIKRGCTVLQATQILSAIVDYDEIILLDRGRVIHRGTHGELLAASSWYADLFQKGEAV
jgi:ABC-type bacteriocin/lantibiotic exporter with double-glycine peptidase domain